MIYQKVFSIVIALLFLSFSLFSQEIIYLENPSYEGTPRASTLVKEWNYCTFNGQSPPDIQPGSFGVSKKAYDGNSYLGLVTRADTTFELVQQELSHPLEVGYCYQWNISVAQSKYYLSISKVSLRTESFTDPVNIFIHGSLDDDCKSLELLATANNIHKLHQWKTYQFLLQPKKPYKFLIISVGHLASNPSGKGHILLDYFTPLIPVDCNSKKINTSIPKSTFLLKDIQSKEKEAKIDTLINLVQFDHLINNGYLNYQLYQDETKNYLYDNLFFNELMNSFPKSGKQEIIFLFKSLTNEINISKYIKSYIRQRELDTNFKVVLNSERLFKKYYKKHTLLFERGQFLIFVEEKD